MEEREARRYRHRWYGKYRAFVRDHHDPERLGRVRLEVPAVLGTGPENWSDWAAPCFPYGGNPDEGMFLVPGEGASVWAEFEGGHPQYPIWSGVWLAGSNPGEQATESQALCPSAVCLDCEDAIEHSGGSDGKEHGKYHGHPPFYCPRIRTLLKTETGHTIVASDQDGREHLEIIDRAGQSLLFDGKIQPGQQAGNSMARRTRTARAGDHMPLWGGLVDQHGRILLTDAARQSFLMDAKANEERIVLTSNDVNLGRWQKVTLDTTAGTENIHLQGLNGFQEIIIDSTAGVEKIRLQDKAGQLVILDATAGAERIHVQDKLGQIITLDAVVGSITARDVWGSSIVMQGGNIQATATANILAQATANITATAGANIAVTAGETVTVTAQKILLN